MFRSLRVRLLLPLLTVALLASIGVAIGSYALAERWMRQELASRYRGIEATLSQATFPLTQPVIDSLASLTDTELLAFDEQGRIVASSLRGLSSTPIASSTGHRAPLDEIAIVNGRSYRVASIERSRVSTDRTSRVAVLFNEDDLRAQRLRAASLPLLTGLSTIVLLTSVTYSLTNRLIGRLSRLQQQVNKIAEGDFDTILPPGSRDEVGLLSSSIQTMSDQLRRMWATLRRQQGEKLLHQLAGGLSHQLRNSITGARMAIELHVKHCQQADEASQIAIAQLDQTEAYLKRLLLAASGKQQTDQPRTLGECLSEVRETLSVTARHLNVALSWQFEGDPSLASVADGPSLVSAVSNLVLNALQAATEVSVVVRSNESEATISVVDNGQGPPASLADEIFEPFVTSKPEGLGLGLPVVAEAVRRLGGTVSWDRVNHHTQFTMSIPVTTV